MVNTVFCVCVFVLAKVDIKQLISFQFTEQTRNHRVMLSAIMVQSKGKSIIKIYDECSATNRKYAKQLIYFWLLIIVLVVVLIFLQVFKTLRYVKTIEYAYVTFIFSSYQNNKA